MKCIACSTENDEQATVCVSCGASLALAPEANAGNGSSAPAPAAMASDDKTAGGLLGALVAVIAVVAVAAIAFLFAGGNIGIRTTAGFGANATAFDLSRIVGSSDSHNVAARLSDLHEATASSYYGEPLTAFETTEGLAQSYIGNSYAFEMQSDEDGEHLKDDFVLLLMGDDATSTLSLDDIGNGAVPKIAYLLGICTERLTPEQAVDYLERYLTIDQCVIEDHGYSLYGYFKAGDAYGIVDFSEFGSNGTGEFSKYRVSMAIAAYSPDGENGDMATQAYEEFADAYEDAVPVAGKVYKR